ncbi:MAG TPA: c-type cytochrome [Chryseolinea sp.]|nr:c-type cytochrome [Chryseolinea sp.]
MSNKVVCICIPIFGLLLFSCSADNKTTISQSTIPFSKELWQAPDTNLIPATPEGKLIRYGRELIVHTSKYLGPNGKVKSISNGMNCQNCHLNAGTKPFGNNYGSVASLYPRFRARSGTDESIEKRVNDCLERSLNGVALEKRSKELHAIVAYIKWIGSNVTKGEKALGSGLKDIEFLDRPCDSTKGRLLYLAKCTQCHGKNGEGSTTSGSSEYTYPPLWGMNSFNQGAGLFRISTMAKYIHANMPFGARYDSTLLTVEEAWDISAYINSRQRPYKNFSNDWPKIETKPFDHPFGPFADSFPETQHKFGPFQEIIATTKSK